MLDTARAMSQENVEVVKSGFAAWNAGDMDALREYFDPGVIMRMPEGWPEPGPYVGREAVMRQVGQQRETWDADAFELISDFIDAGDRVAVRFIWLGAGHGPEAKADVEYVRSAEYRSHVSSLGGKLRGFCNGTRFRYASARKQANGLIGTHARGKVFGVEFLWDHAETLEAVWLSEQDARADS